MTPAQKTLYWREWAAVTASLKARGLPYGDEARHALHVKALGRDRSMKVLTNAEFDKVLGAFRSISQPDDLDAQLRQIDQPAERLQKLRDRIQSLTEECDIEDGIDGLPIYFRFFFKGRTYESLDERGLQQLCGILARRVKTLRLRASKLMEPTHDGNPF